MEAHAHSRNVQPDHSQTTDRQITDRHNTDRKTIDRRRRAPHLLARNGAVPRAVSEHHVLEGQVVRRVQAARCAQLTLLRSPQACVHMPFCSHVCVRMRACVNVTTSAFMFVCYMSRYKHTRKDTCAPHNVYGRSSTLI